MFANENGPRSNEGQVEDHAYSYFTAEGRDWPSDYDAGRARMCCFCSRDSTHAAYRLETPELNEPLCDDHATVAWLVLDGDEKPRQRLGLVGVENDASRLVTVTSYRVLLDALWPQLTEAQRDRVFDGEWPDLAENLKRLLRDSDASGTRWRGASTDGTD